MAVKTVRYTLLLALLGAVCATAQARSAEPTVTLICHNGCVVGDIIDVTGFGFAPHPQDLHYTLTGPSVAPFSSLLYGQPLADGTVQFNLGGEMFPNAGDYTLTFTQGKKTVYSVTFAIVVVT